MSVVVTELLQATRKDVLTNVLDTAAQRIDATWLVPLLLAAMGAFPVTGNAVGCSAFQPTRRSSGKRRSSSAKRLLLAYEVPF